MIEVNLEDLCAKMCSAFGEESEHAPLATFLAATEALQMVHHSHHWQTKGSNSYGDHILFQRLYEQILTEIDLVGEKLIGVSGDAKLTNYFARMKAIQVFLGAVSTGEPYVVVSHGAEQLYLKLGEMVVSKLEEVGLLSTGVENMLGAVLDKHEEHLYLLQRRVRGQ